MKRRDFVLWIGTLAGMSPLVALAQQPPKVRRIGYLAAQPRSTTKAPVLFPSSLAKAGWIEGRNLIIEWRFADGDMQRLSILASELVNLRVEVIVTSSAPDIEAAHRATRSIPIVTVWALDPIAMGLAKNLARPGGNVTGVIATDPAFAAKAVQLLMETLPRTKRIGNLFFADETPAVVTYRDAADAAARSMGAISLRFPIKQLADVGPALAAAKEQRVDALRISLTGPLNAAMDQILAFSATSKIPTYWTSTFAVERGGFMSYMSLIPENYALAASAVDRILRGANPAEMPFVYPTRYELVINLKTAKQLGITVPPSILGRADRLIE